MQLQATYTPTAMDYDFALITLSQPASSSAGFLGMTVGTSSVTLNLTSAGYPVRSQLPICIVLSSPGVYVQSNP